MRNAILYKRPPALPSLLLGATNAQALPLSGDWAAFHSFVADTDKTPEETDHLGSRSGTKDLHNAFMQKVGTDFKGVYYLRAKPVVKSNVPFTMPILTISVDNTYVAPRFFNRKIRWRNL